MPAFITICTAYWWRNGRIDMKRSIFLFLLIIQGFILTSCAARETIFNKENDKINIVCTTFPQYDWVRNIISGNEKQFTITLLTKNGGDLHSFQPSALDIARISSCDIFIYIGGESDLWVEDIIKEAVNPSMCAINMMDVVSLYLLEEEDIEKGMFQTQNHAHHDHDEHEMDEHIWLSLRNAEVIVEYIAAKLEEFDSANVKLYKRNCEDYLSKLRALDAEFVKAIKDSKLDTLLFADRFPFRYFVEDYGLNYYAAYDGCSAETQVSFETVAFLSGKMDELKLKTVLVIDGSDDRLAQVIIQNTHASNQEILTLNSLQSVSSKEISNGYSYLSAMEDNLNTLKKALM